jgi:WD40 repeat protein
LQTASLFILATVGIIGAGLVVRSPYSPAIAQARAADQPASRNEDVRPKLLQVKEEDAWISFLAWGRDGKTLAGVTLDAAGSPADGLRIDGSAVRIWDVASGKIKRTLADNELEKPLWTQAGVAFSADGKLVAAKGDIKGLGNTGSLVVWEAGTGEVKHRLTHSYVHQIAFSPDSTTVAAAGKKKDNREVIELWAMSTGELLATIDAEGKSVSSLVFSPKGDRLAGMLSDGKGSEVVLWDASSRDRLLTVVESDGFNQIAFLPNGKSILGYAPKESRLAVWDATTGKATDKWDLETGFSNDAASRFAVSRDCKTVAIAGKRGDDELIILFDASTGKKTKTLKAPNGSITCVALSPDGQMLACGTQDNKLFVWDLGK